MPYYKDANSKVYFLDDAQFESMLPAGCNPITDGEAATLQAPTAAQIWSGYQAGAQAELDFSDRVATRCIKAGVAYPADWLARDVALRSSVSLLPGRS